MVQDLFWYAAYALSAVGSLSFGYITLRLGYPDVRMMRWAKKLQLSLAFGVVYFVPSLLLSLLLLRESFFVIFPLATIVTTGIFYMKNSVSPAKTVNVAFPIVSINPLPQLPTTAKLKLAAKKPAKAAPLSPKYCGMCGAKMSGTDTFCGRCGASL